MAQQTRVVTAHLPKTMAEALDELACRTDRPRGWLVKEAVGAYLAEEAEKDRLTREALAELDAGAETIPHEEVMAELDALVASFSRQAGDSEKD